jgi:hypothetical protein
MRSVKLFSALLCSIAISACGGGGGDSPPPPPPASNTLTGVVAKGSVGNAEVLVFKAGDYSGPADDAKALNTTPAPTDASGNYSVVVKYSGPVIVVVRPKTTGSTMLNELGGGTLPFNFRMRTALPSVVTNTTAHITPFTEMAAKAVGNSTSADVIRSANWAVRTKVLPGLDPLTTSPIVDSRLAITEQSAQKQMVVALAAVVQAGNSTITNSAGTICNTLAAGELQIACAVDAISSSVTSPTASNVNIDGSKVAALSAAMSALTNINVPTLDANGALITTTTLNTATDADAAALVTSVASNSATLGTGTTVPVTPPTTTVLSGVAQAKAFFSDLRTNLHVFTNGAQSGLLDVQATRINADLAGTIAPNVGNTLNRLGAMVNGADLFLNPSAIDPNCVTNGTTVTCQIKDNNNFFFPFPGLIENSVEVVMTATTATSATTTASYTATAKQCTYDINGLCVPATDTSKALGSGTFTRLTILGKMTDAHVDGTFPSSNVGTVQDSIKLDATGLNSTANPRRIDISGIVSSYGGTPTAVDTAAKSSIAIGTGSYATATPVTHTKWLTGFTCDAFGCSVPVYVNCTVNCTSYESTGLHVVLVANTAASKFTGTVDMGGFMFDKSQTKWTPTTLSFNGVIADTSSNGAGDFLTGKFDASISNYANLDTNLSNSTTNYIQGLASFTGTIAFPGAQTMKLVISGNNNGYFFRKGTGNISFTYGTGKVISVVSAPVDNTGGGTRITLTNQDGIKLTLGGAGGAPVVVGSTVVATVTGNTINYSDGFIESLN